MGSVSYPAGVKQPEWKSVRRRRYLTQLGRSLERGTRWVQFEHNGPRLWAKVRRTIADLLSVERENGGLRGNKPEQAYFVRCDRTTMTQTDIDNGRLIALVGVAPIKPAEFVIIRIGQWTRDRKRKDDD